METLTEQKCVPCTGRERPASDDEVREYLEQVPDWRIVEHDGVNHLERIFNFHNYPEAVEFTNEVARAAEEQNHHPRIVLDYARVTVTWWTHKIKGLHRNDFIMAAKTDEIFG